MSGRAIGGEGRRCVVMSLLRHLGNHANRPFSSMHRQCRTRIDARDETANEAGESLAYRLCKLGCVGVNDTDPFELAACKGHVDPSHHRMNCIACSSEDARLAIFDPNEA